MLRKTYRLRLLALSVLTVAVFARLEARLYRIQVQRHEEMKAWAERSQAQTKTLIPRRGDILDRNGDTLATSYLADTIYLNTRKLTGDHAAKAEPLVAELAGLLQRSEASLRATYFERPGNRVLYRKAPPELSRAIRALERRLQLPPGTFEYPENGKRVYPHDSLAAHVLGFTTVDDAGDNIGLAGVERMYDEWLRGAYRQARVPVSALGRGLAPVDEALIDQTYGATVVLTIDRQVQTFVERALRRRVNEAQARGGVAVVLDVATGEVLALASCPDFNLNEFARATEAQRRNRALSDPIEIGSVMKVITTALLLDQGLVHPDEPVDCHNGYWVIDGRRFTDTHPRGVVPFREAFAESSNIALATLGLRLEPAVYYQGLTRFGLGRRTGIDLPGEEPGVLYPLERWNQWSRTSLPIGFETSLTAIQVASALAAVGNGGLRMRPHVVREIRTHQGRTIKRFEPEELDQVVGEPTARTLLELMETVVDDGTGREARVPGYRTGGKTGTTPKSVARENRQYIASFAGLLPIDRPRVAIYVYIDEPRTGSIYGGAVAAPVFREIAFHIAPLLDIPPSDPEAYARARAELEAGQSPEQLFAAAPPAGAESAVDSERPVAVETSPAGDAAPSTASADGAARMPNLVGMTMVQALAALAEQGLTARLLGSGVAVQQEPPPGALVADPAAVRVVFAPPSARLESAGPSPGGSLQ